MESGLGAAPTQLENRQRRFGLRLLSLPQGDQARGIVGAPTEIGRRLTNALAYAGRVESTVLLEEPETLDAELLQEEEAEAKAAAEKERPGLTMFTDGSRLDNGADGHAVVWKHSRSWRDIKTHMRYNQEAYEAECAALASALQAAWRRPTTPERFTIFTDAQAAIRRKASDEPGPGQQYALQARKHIAALRRVKPGITIEIRWCQAHKGIAGNEKADECAKIAEEEPGTRGVEWLSYSDRTEARPMPLPRSLAKLKREILEKKWAEAHQWEGGSNLEEEVPHAGQPKAQRRGGEQHQEARISVLPAEDRALPDQPVPELDEAPTHPTVLVVPVPNTDPGPPRQGVHRVEAAGEDSVGGGEERDREVEGQVEGAGPTGRREVQPGGAGHPLDHGRGQAGAGGGGGRRRKRGV